MRPLTTAELLQAWESALDLPIDQRGLALLAPACPEYTSQALTALPLGRLDSLLLTLREWTFGPLLTALVDCPGCSAQIELKFNTAELRVAQSHDLAESHELEVDGVHVRFRLPDSRDLAAAGAAQNRESARTLLLERCIQTAERDGHALPLAELQDTVIPAVVAEMMRLDRQADVHLHLVCPVCGTQYSKLFYIGAFFWEEVQRWALRVLREVHSLASAYGWREADILSMSLRRRQFYLQMIHP